MKKNNFLKGFCAKIALATVGLVTAMFTSCSNEDIQIAVKPVNAKAVIMPVVIVEGEVNTTAVCTFSEGNGTYEGSPALTAKTVTVTATADGLSGSVVVNIPSLSAGQSWSQSAVIVLNHGIESYEAVLISTETSTPEVTEKHYDNPSNYWYNVPVTYEKTFTSEVLPGYTYDSSIEGTLKVIESYNFDKSESVTEKYPVYAQSRLIVKKEVVTTLKNYEISLKSRAAKDVIGTFTVKEVNATTVLVDSGAQIPGHDGTPNGHGHGESSNSGGGIVFAD